MTMCSMKAKKPLVENETLSKIHDEKDDLLGKKILPVNTVNKLEK